MCKMAPHGLLGSKRPAFNASLDLKTTNNENAVAAKHTQKVEQKDARSIYRSEVH